MPALPKVYASGHWKARNHPTRREILRVVRGSESPLSATDVKARLEEDGYLDAEDSNSNNHLHYHFRALARSGVLKKVGERRALNGVIVRLYEVGADVEATIDDGAALDSIAERVAQGGGGSDLLGEITKLVEGTGRLPRKTKRLAPPFQVDHRRAAAAPARSTTMVCTCGGLGDDGGSCLSCGKPKVREGVR